MHLRLPRRLTDVLDSSAVHAAARRDTYRRRKRWEYIQMDPEKPAASVRHVDSQRESIRCVCDSSPHLNLYLESIYNGRGWT
jgi:hypothetical protein